MLRQADGFLIVYQKDQQFELDQIEIDKDDFKNWYVSHADTLLSESVSDLEEEIRGREFPELWFYYLDKNSYRHFVEFSMKLSDKKGLWGVPGIVKEFKQLNRFRQIREGDLVLFISGWIFDSCLIGWLLNSFDNHTISPWTERQGFHL